MFSVIIANYNGKEFLETLLSSIAKTKGLSLVTEVIVIDNGSSDGSVETVGKFKNSKNKLQTNFKPQNPNHKSGKAPFGPNIKLIKNKTNLGFAGAINQGVLVAKNDFVAVLNNDLKLDKNWFIHAKKAIEKWSKKEKIAAYFGKVLNQDGTRLESAGLLYWIKGKAFNRGNNQLAKTDKYDKEELIFGAPASAVVYYKPALLEGGLFDQHFFTYQEDVDLNLRLIAFGYETLYLPKMISYHFGGGTSQKMGFLRQKMTVRNWWFIIIKNYPFSVLVKYGPEILFERLRNLSGLAKTVNWWKLPGVFLKISLEIVLLFPKMIVKRKPITNLETLIASKA